MATTALEIILRARDDASKVVASAGRRMTSSLQEAEDASRKAGLGMLAVGAAVAGLGAIGIRQAGSLESLQMALETVTGSSDDAKRALSEIKRVAADSPFFETQTLAQFVQLMAAGGQNIDQAVQSGIAFGDVMAAFGKGNGELARLGNTISQVIGKGKADAVDFKELVNSGWVSVRRDTAEAMGVTIAQFEEMVSAGEVGYDDIRKAAEKFTGAAEKQSTTFNAIMQRMRESFQNLLADLVVDTGIFDGFKNALNSLIVFLDANRPAILSFMKGAIGWIKDNGPLIAGVIAGILLPAVFGLVAAFVSATAALAPFIAAGAAAGVVDKLVADNWGTVGPVVMQVVNAIVGFLAPSLRQLWSVVTGQLAPALRDLWQIVGPLLIPVLKILGGAVLLGLVAAIRVTIEAVTFLVRAWALFLNIEVAVIKFVANLIGWFGQLPGRITQFFADLYTGITTWISSAATSATTWTERLVTGVINWFQQLPGRVYHFLVDLFINKIPYAIGYAIGYASVMVPKLINDTVAWFSALPGRVQVYLTQLLFNIQSSMSQIWNTAISWTQRTIDGISRWFAQLPGRIAGFFVGTAHAAGNGMQRTANVATAGAANLVNSVSSFLSSLPGRVAGAIGAIPGIVGGIFQSAANAAMGALNRLWGGVVQIWNKISGAIDRIRGAFSSGFNAARNAIPGFANGTNFSPGGLAVVGERGPELVNLPRGSQVIPNHKLGAAGGFTIQNMTINNYTPTDQQAMMADLGWAVARRIG